MVLAVTRAWLFPGDDGNGSAWETSVWNDKTYGTLLAVPKGVRGDKGDGGRTGRRRDAVGRHFQ